MSSDATMRPTTKAELISMRWIETYGLDPESLSEALIGKQWFRFDSVTTYVDPRVQHAMPLDIVVHLHADGQYGHEVVVVPLNEIKAWKFR